MRTAYFAYGANMDERAMRARCPSSRCLGAARLDDHRLAFTRRSIHTGTGVADVVADARRAVWGVLYELDDGDLQELDRKEGQGWAYGRRAMSITRSADGARRDALVYTVLVKEHAEVAPSREYLAAMIDAARRHALPSDYIRLLQARADG
jgi:gamma-glutamylcyclotransferase